MRPSGSLDPQSVIQAMMSIHVFPGPASDPDEAAIGRGIFEAYTGGVSPRRIARTPNAEGIVGPRCGVWFNSSIRGRATRG
jgi:hypothetical protein